MTTLMAGSAAMFVAFTTYSSCAPGTAAPPPTTVTCFVIESCWPTPTTTTVGSGPVAGLPSPSVSRFGNSTLSHHGLVADQRSRRRTGVDAQIELKDCRGSGRDRAGVDARSERRDAAIRLPDRRSVEQRANSRRRSYSPEPCRVRTTPVAADRAGVLYRDRVAQRIARIDDARRTEIDEQRDALLGIERGQRCPDMLPTTIETLALAVCVGLFQATTPVFVTTAPFERPALRTARNRSSYDRARPPACPLTVA